MSRIWLELLEDDLASSDEKRVYSAIRKIAEDDTGDATYIEQRLAEMLLSNLPCWISVDDRLPEKGLRTLVYAPELDETMKIRIIDSQFFKICSDVTHWMPLPAPPDTEKEK